MAKPKKTKPKKRSASKKTTSTSTKRSSPKATRRRNPVLSAVSEPDIRDALKRSSSFSYTGDLPLYDTWSLGPVVEHRDSTLLARANWKALELELEKHPEWQDQWEITGATHWVVGWVDHLSFEVLDPQGQPTDIFRFLKGWFDALSDSIVANEDLYSEMQFEAYAERLEQDLDDLERTKLSDELPEDWRDQMVEKLRELGEEYDQEGVAYHDESTLEDVAEELGFLDHEMAANPEPEDVYLVLRNADSGHLAGGRVVALDYGQDGTVHALLYNEDVDAQFEWIYRPDMGWHGGPYASGYELVAMVTPDSRKVANPEISLGAGTGAWLGFALGNTVATLATVVLGMSWGGALLTFWTAATLGAAIGSYMAAPNDRKRRAAIGAGVGNVVFPIVGIGAALGGWIGAKHPDPQHVQENRRRRQADVATGTRPAKASNPTHRKIKNRVLR